MVSEDYTKEDLMKRVISNIEGMEFDGLAIYMDYNKSDEIIKNFFSVLVQEEYLNDRDIPIPLDSERWLISDETTAGSRRMSEPVQIEGGYYVETDISKSLMKQSMLETVSIVSHLELEDENSSVSSDEG